MQTKTFAFETYTISYRYDDSKPWTEDDESLEKVYTALVKNEVELHEMVYDSIMELEPISKEIESTRELLMLIKDFSIAAREEADNLMLSFMNPDEDTYDRDLLTETVQNTENAFAEYHAKLTLLEPRITLVSDFVDKYTMMSEDESEWDIFSDVVIAHGSNYATNSIDMCSFDAEKEMFLAFVNLHKDISDSITRTQDGYVVDFNTLMLQTEMEYGIWNEFVKRLDLLTKMVKVKAPSIISDELNLN